MIKLQVIGNLGKDCIVNNVNGKTVINFSVAHTEKFKDAQGNQKDKTIWVECAYWTDRTGISPYLVKGKTVYVEGTPDVRTYTTNDGRNGASLSLRVQSVQLIGGRSEGSPGGYNESNSYSGGSLNNQRSEVPAASDITEPMDDLPF
ncbi:MAG TPA: single-stranded DNA-binding protein [Chitinophagaceae bacterium]|nr:single-stranded DNA-binding protein [Chitinophagaceae bacterium]